MNDYKETNKNELKETLDGPVLTPKNNQQNQQQNEARHQEVEEEELVKTVKPQLVFTLANGDKPQHYYTTNGVSLQDIEKDFNHYLGFLSADLGLSPAKLQDQGYKASYNKEGTLLTLSFGNPEHGNDFFQKLQNENKINGPFLMDKNAQQNLLPQPKPGAAVKGEDEDKNQQLGFNTAPTPFGNLGQIPRLTRT